MGPFCYLHTKNTKQTLRRYEINVLSEQLNEDTVRLRIYYKAVQRDSKRWTQFRTSIFPELYMVCG